MSFISYLTQFRRGNTENTKHEDRQIRKTHWSPNDLYFSYGAGFANDGVSSIKTMKIFSRTEEIEIAKKRNQMSKASIVELIEEKKNIISKYPYPYSENGIENLFQKGMFLRDLYSYAIINYLGIQHNFKVFGGFVASHISGKNWTNIDMMAPYERLTQMEFMTQIVTFLRFIFGFKSTDLSLIDKTDYEQINYGYYDTFKYLLHINEGYLKHEIKINVMNRSFHRGLISDTDYIPATIGKCLIMHNNKISMRKLHTNYIVPPILNTWSADDVIELLRNGKDIGLNFEEITDDDSYIRYFHRHIKRAREMTYEIDRFIGNIIIPYRCQFPNCEE